jgi:hypothetical protein
MSEMRIAKATNWECGECGLALQAGEAFAWCDGCSKIVCEECLDDATICERCDLIACHHCSLRRFTASCDGCGMELHTDCPAGAGIEGMCQACMAESSARLAS